MESKKKFDEPERLARADITLLPVCEETVHLKYVPCVNGILKITTNFFFSFGL